MRAYMNAHKYKVSGAYVVTLLNWTCFLKWCIARLVLKNGNQKEMCQMRLEDVLKICIILVSKVNITIGVAYVIVSREQESSI
jgi:hypothetical protein